MPRYTLISKRYGNIDSNGDKHVFEEKVNCIAPAIDNDGRFNLEWQCSSEGMAAPFSFVIGAYEQDADPIQSLIDIFSGTWVDFDAGQNTERSDLGKDDVKYSLAELLDKLPQVGQSFTAR